MVLNLMKIENFYPTKRIVKHDLVYLVEHLTNRKNVKKMRMVDFDGEYKKLIQSVGKSWNHYYVVVLALNRQSKFDVIPPVCLYLLEKKRRTRGKEEDNRCSWWFLLYFIQVKQGFK